MRLAPLPADEWDDAVEHALAQILPAERRNPAGAGNALATLVRHPRLARAFLRFNGHLLYSSTLPPRVRELAILRVAHRRDCTYEWVHHVEMGKDAGLTDDDIAAARRARPATDSIAPCWAPSTNSRRNHSSRMRLGRRFPSGLTSGSAWTSFSRSVAMACWPWPSTLLA
jgi:AhpD family alkylhydroperoxidase